MDRSIAEIKLRIQEWALFHVAFSFVSYEYCLNASLKTAINHATVRKTNIEDGWIGWIDGYDTISL